MSDAVDDFSVSPNYMRSYLTESPHTEHLSRAIDVFEDRTNGWFLNYAENLNKSDDPHCGFAVLKLVFSYFEMITQYQSGSMSNGNSKESFKQGVESVFGNILPEENKTKILDILYQSGRCGFYHAGMSRGHFFTRDGDSAIQFEDGKVYIDRYKFVETIKTHFSEYIKILKNPESTDPRDKFQTVWNDVNSGKIY